MTDTGTIVIPVKRAPVRFLATASRTRRRRWISSGVLLDARVNARAERVGMRGVLDTAVGFAHSAHGGREHVCRDLQVGARHARTLVAGAALATDVQVQAAAVVNRRAGVEVALGLVRAPRDGARIVMSTAAALKTLIRSIFAVRPPIDAMPVITGAITFEVGWNALPVVTREVDLIVASTVVAVEIPLLAVPVGVVHVGVVPQAVVAVAIAPSRAIVAVPVAVGVLAVAVVVRGLFPVVAGRRVRAPEDLMNT